MKRVRDNLKYISILVIALAIALFIPPSTSADSTSHYDFAITTDKWAYTYNSTVLPSSPLVRNDEATTDEYTALSSSDDTYFNTTNATADGEIDMQIFIFNISETRGAVTNITLIWEGYGETESGYYTNVSFYNWTSSSWYEINSTDFTAATDQTVTYVLNGAVFDFINDTNNEVAVLVATTKYVAAAAVCGNGILEGEEVCDAGEVKSSCDCSEPGESECLLISVFHECFECAECVDCYATCDSPYIYTYYDNRYTKLSDFIAGATSKEKEYVSFIDISDSEVKDRLLRLKITEELDETTYLDQYSLVLYDYPKERKIEFYEWIEGNLEYLNAHNSRLRLFAVLPDYVKKTTLKEIGQEQETLYSDDDYLMMEEGFEKELEFIIPYLSDGHDRKIFFVTEGYYIEHYKNKQETSQEKHRSLYTDHLSLKVNYTSSDLFINESKTYFTYENFVDGENFTITALIQNLGAWDANNTNVEFYQGNSSHGTLLDNHSINVSGNSNLTVNSSWISKTGVTNFTIIADPPLDTNGTVAESNETNNRAKTNISISSWYHVVGNITGKLTLGDDLNRTITNWDLTNINTTRILVADSDSTIDFSSLYAITRKTNGEYAPEDFDQLDKILFMENNSDSLNETYMDTDNEPEMVASYNVRGGLITNVPIMNNSILDNFQTGALWDSTKDDDGSFDDTDKEDVVFISQSMQETEGQYGIYDFEIKVPANLKLFDTGDSSDVTIYLEVT